MFNRTKLSFSNKNYTVGGIASSVLAVISVAILGYSIYLSFSVRGLGGTMIGSLGLLSMLIAFFGFIFGVVSYREEDKHYGFSFFGTLANGLIFILLVFFIIMA